MFFSKDKKLIALATDYSHKTKPGTTARTKEESICICKTRLGQVYKRDRN